LDYSTLVIRSLSVLFGVTLLSLALRDFLPVLESWQRRFVFAWFVVGTAVFLLAPSYPDIFRRIASDIFEAAGAFFLGSFFLAYYALPALRLQLKSKDIAIGALSQMLDHAAARSNPPIDAKQVHRLLIRTSRLSASRRAYFRARRLEHEGYEELTIGLSIE
jgi:hypothetical protein